MISLLVEAQLTHNVTSVSSVQHSDRTTLYIICYGQDKSSCHLTPYNAVTIPLMIYEIYIYIFIFPIQLKILIHHSEKGQADNTKKYLRSEQIKLRAIR